MGYARKDIVDTKEVGVYHCVSRCVRRAFLCGWDAYSKKSFEHRREWIRHRLATLVEIFAIEVIAYAVMSNHVHDLIRSRLDLALLWSDEEVATRWRMLFPKRRSKSGAPAKPNEEEILAITSQKKLVATYRERLSSISWFHRCLNENIAKRANYEDDCTGRFWEGRFKCQRIYDIAGFVACSAYIDLNPIRAGIAKTPETSNHTSIQDRIFEQTKKPSAEHKSWRKIPLVTIPEISGNYLTLTEYLTLVDETGRLIVSGKKSISKEIAPILERLKINQEVWVDKTEFFRNSFRRVVGPEERLRAVAKKLKKCWLQGVGAAREMFYGAPVVAVT